MNKKEIQEKLQKTLNRSSVKLPSGMEFSIAAGVLTIGMTAKGLAANMQQDNACFESWALCLKRWLSGDIERVEIRWDAPQLAETPRYRQFLYRVFKFVSNYDWVSCAPGVLLPFDYTNKVVNYPLSVVGKAKKEEAKLERKYIAKHENEFEVMASQLPVCLFDRKVGKETRVTSGGFLDIWAIRDNDLYIYELKKEDNIRTGILSELSYYTHILKDIIDGKINYAGTSSYRSFDKLYEAVMGKRLKTVRGVLLTDNLHPLIDSGVLELMNTNHEKIVYTWEKTE